MSKIVKKPKVKIVRRLGRPLKLPGWWSDLARAAKGVEPLSREVGKSVRQLRRIAHRESPLTGSTRITVHSVAVKYGMLKELEEWERGSKAQ